MAVERILPKNFEQQKLNELNQLQEDTATRIFTFINKSIGDFYPFGRNGTIKIVAGPRDFVLTLYNDDGSRIIFDADEFNFDVNLTGVESKYTLSYLKPEENGTSLTLYRFNQNKTYKSYKNGQSEAKISEMTDNDKAETLKLLQTIPQLKG